MKTIIAAAAVLALYCGVLIAVGATILDEGVQRMKSMWQVERSTGKGKRMYRAYRVIDVSRPNVYGNREYIGVASSDRSAVEALVDRLNEDV